MSKNILFLDENTVKSRSNLNENVDPKLITPAIKYCQDIYIEPVLGTELFRKIQGDVSGQTLAGEYKTLVDEYLTDVLLYYVLSEMPIMLGYKFFNKNVLKKQSENSVDATGDELDKLAKWYRNKAEYYEKRMIAYLVEEDGNQPKKFPEYDTDNTRCDFIKPKKRPYSSSIYLGLDSGKKTPSFSSTNQGGQSEAQIKEIDGGEV
jgi:hypothetical protein